MCPNALITIGGRGFLYGYGLMIAIGLLACFLVMYGYGKYFGASGKLLDFCFYTAIGAVVVGFGGAALFQALYNFIADPSKGFRFSGITVIPGVVTGAAFFLAIYFGIYRLLSKERIYVMIPIAPCCITIAHAFGRIGCFLGGCCYGREGKNFFSVHFPANNFRGEIDAIPTNLYEAIFLFVLFGVCTFLLFRFKYRLTFPLYLMSYGIWRFFIEFLRGDSRGSFIPGLSPSQFWAILLILGSIPFFILLSRFYKKMDAKKAAEAAAQPAMETNTESVPANEE